MAGSGGVPSYPGPAPYCHGLPCWDEATADFVMAVSPTISSTAPPSFTETLTKSTPDSGTIRLHISPLNVGTLSHILGPVLSSAASNVSFHTLQTFPEADYGFVDLPTKEAVKFREKMNGSILRGTRMRVEKARPIAKESGEPPQNSAADQTRPKRRKASGSAGLGQVIVAGKELLEGRHVRRGWTKPPSSDLKSTKSSRRKPSTANISSLLTPRSECLFRANLPPSRAIADLPPVAAADSLKSEPTSKGPPGRHVVVREFTRTTKHPTFLRSHGDKNAHDVVAEYIDGKGWVTGEGTLVEAATGKNASAEEETKSSPIASDLAERGVRGNSKSLADGDDSGISHRPGSVDRKIDRSKRPKADQKGDCSDAELMAGERERVGDLAEGSGPADSATKPLSTSRTSKRSQRGSSPGKSASATSSTALSGPKRAVGVDPGVSTTLEGAGPSLTITIPATAPREKSGHPHPLETLFKPPGRRRERSSLPRISIETETDFNFFGADAENEEGVADVMPQTPFTRWDYYDRGQRSAAPTPDTAAPGRKFSFAWRTSKEDKVNGDRNAPKTPTTMEKDSVKGTSVSDESNEQHQPKSFEDSFWERRGDSNRAWKKRRRDTGKEKRKDENRRLGFRGS